MNYIIIALLVATAIFYELAIRREKRRVGGLEARNRVVTAELGIARAKFVAMLLAPFNAMSVDTIDEVSK